MELEIRVLGSAGSRRCDMLYDAVLQAVSELGIEAHTEYVTDLSWVSEYGTMKTPVLVIGKNVVSMGRELTPEQVKEKLARFL